MNILICDDDCKVREFLDNCINRYYEGKIGIQVKQCGSVAEARKELVTKNYDTYFLDIELEDGTGIELAKTIRLSDKRCNIIFITSHTEFMADAFGVHAYHYLQKPVTEQAINSVLQQLQDYMQYKDNNKFFFKFNKEQYSLNYDSIIAFISETRKNTIISSEGLYEYYGKFADLRNYVPKREFAAVRNNFIINMDYIKNVCDSTIYYEIPEKLGLQSVNISKGCKKDFNKAFAEYMKNGNN